MRETKETFLTLSVVACLLAGLVGAVFYTVGPEGWLVNLGRSLLNDPDLWTLAALTSVIGLAATGKRWLDNNPKSVLNNLLLGVVVLGGFAILLRGIRNFFA